MRNVRIKLKVFGRRLDVERVNGEWGVYYVGNEGKRRRATDIVIPDTTSSAAIPSYLGDLLHEWANEKHPDVTILTPLL